MLLPVPMYTPQIDDFKTEENVTLALRIIDKLLADPIGNQLWRKEIAMLFRLIDTTEVPPIIVKQEEKNDG